MPRAVTPDRWMLPCVVIDADPWATSGTPVSRLKQVVTEDIFTMPWTLAGITAALLEFGGVPRLQLEPTLKSPPRGLIKVSVIIVGTVRSSSTSSTGRTVLLWSLGCR
jgi:hypothetical protein